MEEGAATPLASVIHEPPSLPNSPEHKRTKVIDPKPFTSSLAVELFPDEGRASPTPVAMTSAPTESVPSLQVQLLSPKAQAPTRGSDFAAGYDLYSAEDNAVPARGKAMISTGIAIAVPAGTYGRVAPRSGLAAKHSIDTGAGVIDADYRGEVKVILFNFSDNDFAIKTGDRIAQLIIERIYTPEVAVVEKLDESVRGAGGFGSTGGFGAAINGV
ncbi:dUTPase [Tothia fuscella]|uniref:Deoxyuridine 5'-triphosphate nucleotidohydrolase n=1 Tax=Tothia fuscella TaxID=1048955 RepID=A0A9P4NX87_9PEZI|nr:dUTPase [Tothia fuscella]